VIVNMHGRTTIKNERECSAIRFFTPSSGNRFPVVIGEKTKWMPEPDAV
jgi:hypothetical protein